MKILFAGEGGQGVQAIAQILTKAAFAEGKHALYIPNFGVEQRGGVSLAFVVIDEKPISYPKFQTADILALFSDRSFSRTKSYLGKNTQLILGPGLTQKIKKGQQVKSRGLPSKVWNILVLAAVNQVGHLVELETLKKAMSERFAAQFEKNPNLRKLDLEAIGA